MADEPRDLPAGRVEEEPETVACPPAATDAAGEPDAAGGPNAAGPASPEMWRAPVRPARWRTRLWVMCVAGLAVPAAMTLGGMVLAWILRRDPLWLTLTADQPWIPVLLWSLLGMGLSLGFTAGLASVWPQFARALEESGLRAGEDVLQVAGLPVMAAVVAVAGVGEEFLFRGGLQPSVGVVPAALLFGMAHGIWNLRDLWAYVLSAALAGVAFGGIYAHTGLLWSAVLAHAGHNLTVTLYLLHRRSQSSGKPAA